MKKTLTILSLVWSTLLFAQNEKTLLWEISGNGLAKKSYLYGTMHVNEKISYHLSDAFYKHLLEADIVSNESDPETWESLFDLFLSNRTESNDKFYNSFSLSPLKKDDLYQLFNFYNLYNSMTSSGNEGDNTDYQESTVLDMFIHQTGKKYNKIVTGLEEAKGSYLKILKVKQQFSEPTEEKKVALNKILKNRNFLTVSNDYYREKDVVMLDSIYKLVYSKNFHDVLIIDRNQVMTKSIDSLAKKGSLFVAIGAAHLAGKKGVIQLLREKGYTVSPVFDVLTPVGEKQKKTIEEYFPAPVVNNYSSKDGVITMPVFKNVRSYATVTSSVDLTNGGSIGIKRIPINYFLNKKETKFDPKVLDSLFFESIPGTILEKKFTENESYKSYDIKNKTKTGNYQHYRFYITPLELISINMTGNGTYVKQYENQIFDKIEIKNVSSSWRQFTPEKGGFELEIPAFSTVNGNDVNSDEALEIQSFDASDKANYFLIEKVLDDTSVLEDTPFEHQQIQREFYKNNEMEMTSNDFDQPNSKFQSAAVNDTKTVHLKTFIKGANYYLLGAINASEKNRERFFNSFKFVQSNLKEVTKTYTDTISRFKVDVPERLNARLFYDVKPNFDEEEKNKFVSKTEKYSFHSCTGQTVAAVYNKFHKYESVENVDSLKAYCYKSYRKEFSSNIIAQKSELMLPDYTGDYDNDYNYNFSEGSLSALDYNMYSQKGLAKSLWEEIIEKGTDQYELVTQNYSYDAAKNTHIIEAIVSKPKSTQAIKYKTLVKDNSFYQLQTLVDKNYKNEDFFIEKVFHSFEPTGIDSTSIFDDKIQLFIKDAYSKKDTIRFSALQSTGELKISENDFDTLADFIRTFDFKDTETKAMADLISKLGYLKNPKVIPFLVNEYKAENAKTVIQISVLKALSNQNTKVAYEKILELLDYDLPVTDDQYDISSLFFNFQEDLETSKVLFPKIFDWYSIKEYNEPIISFCNALFDKNLVSSKKIKSFKKMIVTNAKLECKRVASWKEKNNDLNEFIPSDIVEDVVDTTAVAAPLGRIGANKFVAEGAAPVDDLINYINLLSHMDADHEVALLFDKIEKLDIPKLNFEFLRLGVLNETITKQKIINALANAKTKFIAVQLLLNKDQYGLLSSLSDDAIAESTVRNFYDFEATTSVNFIEKRIENKNDQEITFYFYKLTSKPEKDELAKNNLFSVAFVSDKGKLNWRAYTFIANTSLELDDDLNEEIKTTITKALNKKHLRATFEKEDSSLMYNEYGD